MRLARSTSPRSTAIEAVTKHDVIAFLTWAGEKLGPAERWLHQGMTSSDVLDTALAVQLKQAADLLIARHRRSAGGAEAPRFRAQADADHRASHGIHAEPATFGLKLAQAYAEFARNRDGWSRRATISPLRDLRRGRHLRAMSRRRSKSMSRRSSA